MSFVLGGLMLAQGISGYMQSKQQYDFALREQQYKIKQQQENNLEARRAGNRKHETVDRNVNKAHEAHTSSLANIDANAMLARSESIVAAAASGTAGLSVSDSILNIERNAAKAEYNASAGLSDTLESLELSREQIESEVRARTNNSLFLPPAKPSLFGAVLGTATGIAGATYGKSWDDETVSNWFSSDSLGDSIGEYSTAATTTSNLSRASYGITGPR